MLSPADLLFEIFSVPLLNTSSSHRTLGLSGHREDARFCRKALICSGCCFPSLDTCKPVKLANVADRIDFWPDPFCIIVSSSQSCFSAIRCFCDSTLLVRVCTETCKIIFKLGRQPGLATVQRQCIRYTSRTPLSHVLEAGAQQLFMLRDIPSEGK